MQTRRAVQLLAICLVAGQALAIEFYKSDGRFYAGDPRPAAEVALLVWDVTASASLCSNFRTLTEEGQPTKRLFGGKTMVEVLPGRYTMETGCPGPESRSLVIDARAGHVYHVWLDRKQADKPLALADIARDEDYGQIKRGDFLKRCVEKYFRGKRHEVKEMDTGKGQMAWN
jgi:hypothetical protein